LRILADESVKVVARLRGRGYDLAYVPEASACIRDG
jgi:hypothetical protein